MRVRVPPAEQKEKDMQLKVFTAFSGYDSQCMALDRLGIGYDLVGWSEIDKYAIQAHNAVYPQYRDRNFGDICHIDWAKVPDFDLFTYSFPCTDISTAGKQRDTQQPVMGMRESDRVKKAEIPAHGKCKVPYRKEIQVFFIGMGTIPFSIRVHEPYEGFECERLRHSP